MINAIYNILGASKSTSTIPPAVADNFTANNVGIQTRAMDSGDTWTAQSGSIWATISGGARISTTTGIGLATVDKGWADVSLKLKIDVASSGTCGALFRYVDNNNYYRIEYAFTTGSGFRLVRVVGGVETVVKFRDHTALNLGSSVKPFDLEVYIFGNRVTAYVGSTVLDYTGLLNTTSTKHGIWMNRLGTNSYTIIKSFVCYKNISSIHWNAPEPPNAVNKVIVTTPSAYQVLQRNGTSANIGISGYYINDGSIRTIQASYNGGSYTTIATSSNGMFSGTLSGQSQGQGTLLVRVLETNHIATVPFVGIGDVIVTAGQSNMTGLGNTRTGYTTPGPKASKFANTYKWAELVEFVDNVDGQIDQVSLDTQIGAVYTMRVVSQFLADQNVPIAIIPCSMGGTSIVAWAKGASSTDRSTLYGSMIYRALQQPNGIKFVLWHQGESDALTVGFLGYAAYKSNLKALADNIFSDLGVPIVVSRIHKFDAPFITTQGQVDAINLAMNDASVENAHVLLGPNYDSPTRVASDIHFITAAEILDAGNRCWTAIKSLFY